MGIGAEIVVEQEGEVYIVRIEGRIDATTTPLIEKKLTKLLEVTHKLLIDFSDVVYLSSAGMRLLLSLTKKINAKGGHVAYYGMSDDVIEIIKMAGFERILSIFSSKKEALKSVSK